MNRLYLVRHGENWANLTKELSYKKVDYPLTPKGVLQAQQTAAYFAGKHVDALYCSPLKRTIETAAWIGRQVGLEPVIVEDFREVNVGDLEGRPVTAETWMEHNAILDGWADGRPERPFPGGENLFGLSGRLQAGIRRVTAGLDGRSIVIVAHGAIFTYPLPGLCPQVDFAFVRSNHNRNCAITEVLAETTPEKVTLQMVRYASIDHLSGAAAQFVPGGMEAHQFDADGRPIEPLPEPPLKFRRYPNQES